ncbi:MAG TPA: hypothetical protein PKN32_08325 [Bacteroidales bacterium]|nr:hypothetical protein [Bacteroidales bacterium]
MKYDVLFNFISPVTGRLCIPEDYILIGDGQGFSMPSPILIDIRLDITNLRRDVNDILDTSFIIAFPDIDFPNAQVLSSLENGFMYNTEGIISTTPTIPITGLTDLTNKHLWIGDENNRPVEKATISIDNLPDLGVGTVNIPNPFNPDTPIVLSRGKIWRGTDSNRPEESNAVTALEADVLLLTSRFLTAAWILRNSGLIPNALRPVLWPNAQFLDDLPINRILSHTTDGTIGVASLTHNKLWIGDENNIPVERLSITTVNLPDLTYNYLWVGNENNRPIEKLTLIIDNLPDLGIATNPIYLGKGRIWRGTPSGRPIESDDLSALEITVDFIQNVTIPAIQADIAAIQGQIAAIQAQLALIETRLTFIETAIAVIQGQILAIQGQIIAINQRIDNLRLNNIPADGDVSFYNFKLINLADPVNQTDGVNLRTLISYINNVPTTIELTGDVTGSGNTGTPISTTLQLTLDQIKIAQNTVNLNDQKIINLKSDDVEQKDALNAKFLWDLMHDQVEVVWQ